MMMGTGKRRHTHCLIDSQLKKLFQVGLTLAPLLGPIGGGLGFGAWASAGGASGAGGAAAPSSAALTTRLELLLLLGVSIKRELLEPEVVEPPTLGVNTNPEAADAMLQEAMSE